MTDRDYRVYLKPISEDDADLIVAWRNSESVKKYFIYQGEFTHEGQLSWIRNRVNTGKVIQFIIIEKTTDKPIGSVFIRDIDPNHNKGEYGIFIGEDEYRGCGYGSEAAELIIDHAFNTAGLHRLYLRVLADNKRAVASYKKVGFVQEGLLKDDVCINGEYRDIIWMAMINPNDNGECAG